MRLSVGIEDAADLIADLEAGHSLMIRFTHVTKEYPRTGVALNDVTFHVAKGEFVFLTGPERRRQDHDPASSSSWRSIPPPARCA